MANLAKFWVTTHFSWLKGVAPFIPAISPINFYYNLEMHVTKITVYAKIQILIKYTW